MRRNPSHSTAWKGLRSIHKKSTIASSILLCSPLEAFLLGLHIYGPIFRCWRNALCILIGEGPSESKSERDAPMVRSTRGEQIFICDLRVDVPLFELYALLHLLHVIPSFVLVKYFQTSLTYRFFELLGVFGVLGVLLACELELA